MRRLCRSGFGALFVAVLALCVSGCGGASGPPRAKIRGEITNNGEPLKVKPMVGRVQVTFYPVTEPGQPPSDPQEAAVLPSGEFKVHGTDGKGILLGKYKIAVRQWEEFPNKDVLQGKCDKDNTKFIRDVTGKEDIILDVKDVMTEISAGK
ncbi:MAG: hypothetical protein JWM11_7593 [Planctomycetaceae bacterium]|nr:hypothetical protein [Planctomycetaceae bacterium]